MKRARLLQNLEKEMAAHLRLLEDVGGECYASALMKAAYARHVEGALAPWRGRLAPVERVIRDGRKVAPEEYALHVPRRYRAPAGTGLPIDQAVSEIRAAGVGFNGESWDELAEWLEENARSRNEIARTLAKERAECREEARGAVPEVLRRMEKTQRLIDRLEACRDGRAGCLGRVALRIERNLWRGRAMRRYWREVHAIAKKAGT